MVHTSHRRTIGESVEKEVDRIVYEVYGFSEEEVKIVEGKP